MTSFIPRHFIDGPAGGTPISAAELNAITTQLATLTSAVYGGAGAVSQQIAAVNAGGSSVVGFTDDTAGSPFSGLVVTNTNQVATTSSAVDLTDQSVASLGLSNTVLTGLFSSERYAFTAPKTLEYDFTVPTGVVTVQLLLAENNSGDQAAGKRVMQVSIGGTVVDSYLDVFALVGGFKAVVRTYQVTAVSTSLPVVLSVLSSSVDLACHLQGIIVTSGTVGSGSTPTNPPSGVTAPNAPTIGTAVLGAASATVPFTPAGTGGAATSYAAVSSPGGFTATGTSSPLVVTGLTGGTAYTFTVTATNSAGSATSGASNSVTPTTPGATTGGFGSTPPLANAAGSVLTVGSGKTYATIQAAMNAASGGTAGTPRQIAVYDGDYREVVTPVNSHVKVWGQSLNTRILGSTRLAPTWTNTTGNIWRTPAPGLSFSTAAYGRTSFFSNMDGTGSQIGKVKNQDMNQLFRDYSTWMLGRNTLAEVTADGDYFIDYTNQFIYVYATANPTTSQSHVFDIATRQYAINWGAPANVQDTEYVGMFIGHSASPFSGAAVWLGRQDKLTDCTVLGSTGRGVNLSVLNVVKGTAAPYTGSAFVYSGSSSSSSQTGTTGSMRIMYCGNTNLCGAPDDGSMADATGTNTSPASASYLYQHTTSQVEIGWGNMLMNSMGDEGGGVKFAFQSNCTFNDNWVHDIFGIGFWLDNQNVGWTLDNNLFERCAAGVNFEANSQKPAFSSVVLMTNTTMRGCGTSWNGSIDMTNVGGWFDHSGIFCTAYRGIVVQHAYIDMTPWTSGHTGCAVTTRGDDGRYTGASSSSFTNIYVLAPTGQKVFAQGSDPVINNNYYKVFNVTDNDFAMFGVCNFTAWQGGNGGHTPMPDASSTIVAGA